MHKRLLGRAAVAFAATAALLSGAGMAAARSQAPAHTGQAAVVLDCADLAPRVCVYQDTNYSGLEVNFIPSQDGGHWISLTAAGLSLPWSSFHNDSQSSVVFGDAQTGAWKCFPANTGRASVSIGSYRYMWIEYGIPDCSGSFGPLP